MILYIHGMKKNCTTLEDINSHGYWGDLVNNIGILSTE